MVGDRPRVEFVLNAEAGILEKQAVLLCESIRHFGGALSSSAITVVSPRKSLRPSPSSLREIDRLGAEFLPLDIEPACPDFGPSLKVHAVAHVARRSGPPVIIQIDSDSLIVAEPAAFLGNFAAAARPVDVKGMCTTGPGDLFDEYWRRACALLCVEYYSMPIVQTTVDRKLVRASYNGGLFAAQRANGIFERAEEFFQKLVDADLRPWKDHPFEMQTGAGKVGEVGTAFWGMGQAALSLAAVAGGHVVELLPGNYNLPLHFLNDLVIGAWPPLIHIHYHWLASSGTGETSALLDARLNLTADVREWLQSRLPLDATG